MSDIVSDAALKEKNDPVLQMAMETLLTLKDYAEILEKLSLETSELLGKFGFQERFLKLIEGIETFAESIVQVKTVLNIRIQDNVVVLESDLTAILKTLLKSQENGNLEDQKDLLKTRLPTNLRDWRTMGIFALEHA